MEAKSDKHLIQSKDIVGFDFERNVVLIRSDKKFFSTKQGFAQGAIYEIEPITPEEAQDLRDFFLNLRHRS